MDETTAIQIALDVPQVQQLIPSGNCEVIKFLVEPGFRAILQIRETDSNNPTTDNTNNDNTSVDTADKTTNKKHRNKTTQKQV
jgi:phage antirepressor YoqD-like protein